MAAQQQGLIKKNDRDPNQGNVYIDSKGPNYGPRGNNSGYGGYGRGHIEGQTFVRAGDTSNDTYRDNLASNVQGKWDVGTKGTFYDYSNDSDSDVRELQRIQNETSAARAGLDRGVDYAKNQAIIDSLKSRIALKNQLGSSIRGNADMEGRAEEGIRNNANAALDSGVKGTRQNYNSRGLLYSGMRQGSEQSVRGSVAAKMGSDLASTKREYANLAEQQKAAYASIGLAQQKEKVDAANQAFDTVSRNQIAKLQAYQQLGSGVGRAVGYMYGSRGDKEKDDLNDRGSGGGGGSYGLGDYSGGRSLEPLSYDQIVGR